MLTLTYIGHSAFHLSDGSNSVLVDPFITGNPTATVSAGEFSPNAILLTHAHNDHVGDTIAIAKRAGSHVIALFELANYIGRAGVEQATGGNMGGTIAFDGGTVKFTPAWHTSSYEDEHGVHAATPPAGLVVRFGGKTIYFAGDTCLFSDMKLIGEEGLDVGIIPIGDAFTMGPADAQRAVEFLNPKIVIPCHYNTFPPIQQDSARFKRDVEERTGVRCEPLAPGESIELTDN
ncbi:MAG: metal-dependent hydrolase [Thermomicrobiales bacterium]|nr:metal-dependent hydrolase [Thermomicrobiales bacterium]